MTQYRKKPVVIDAMQFDGSHASAEAIVAWVNHNTGYTPKSGGSPPILFYYGELKIRTREGEMTGGAGDWIIRGVKGEFYPCKPDIFDATYEPVGQPMTTPEPSPLSEKTLDAWELSARAARFDGRSVDADPERLLELIAQARAARPSPTCMTCKHYQPYTISVKSVGVCAKGVGLRSGFISCEFGCSMHEPSPPAQDGGRP